MTLSANQLTKVVDLPVWEWTRPTPVASTGGVTATCVADATRFNETSGRFIYFLLNATNFWRYDTFADSYEQLATPTALVPATACSMRFVGSWGYCGRTISATSTTMDTGIPYGTLAVGYRIRIISGRGAGQERIITSVSDPIVADFGGASAGAAASITDSSKAWIFNNWVGYVIRTIGGTGLNQVRKVLYNSATSVTVADVNLQAYEPWSVPLGASAVTGFTTVPAAGTQYQIEYNRITVDTAWTVTPDNTSRYLIQSGGVFLASSALVTNGGFALQYYSVLEDIWYGKPTNNNTVVTQPTDISLERFTENSSVWYSGKASSATTSSITDSTADWTVNQWAGYEVYIWTGAGVGQIAQITSNTTTVLTLSAPLAVSPDSTSYFSIIGYDAGTFTSTEGRVVVDTNKTWTVNQWSNYAIRILAGTGAGQLRTIMSNGTNSIVIYDTWNIQPDNTSIYCIQGNSNDMMLTLGANAETYFYRTGDTDLVSHGRILDEGINCVACAMLTDGTSTATQIVYEQKHVAITGLAGTTTITATTAFAHTFKVGQWVAIRGVTSGANDIFNVTGKVQILSVPTATTFTYTPFAAGSGTYQYSNNVTLGASVFADASKYHADTATGGSTTTVTFSRASPTNINGWYAYGTNIAAGAQVQSGAGTTTLTLNLTGAGTPTGTITFTKWPQPVTATYSSGGGANVFTTTMTATVPAYVKGWLATGTNMGIGGIVTGGEGTATLNFSIQNSNTPAGTITFSYPVNNPLPATRTYSSGSGTSIVLTTSAPTYVRGWFVSGTNISNGTTVTGGEGTATITLSTSTSGTPSGTITFYPPSMAPAMYYGIQAAPAMGASALVASAAYSQLVAQNTSNGTVMTPLVATAGTAAGTSKYVIATNDMMGQQINGQNLYLGGVAFGTQSTTTLVDTNTVWATATGSGGSAGTFSFTISVAGSPIHNGWYVSGTGIAAGSRVVSGGGTTTITVDTALTGAVSGTITFTAWSNALVGRRIRMVTSTGINTVNTITTVTPSTGTLAFVAATAATTGATTYMVLPAQDPGTGCYLSWQSDSSVAANRGRYIFRATGGANAQVWSRFDITDDSWIPIYAIPIIETLTSGSMFAYDQLDRIYYTKDITNRVYYLNLVNYTIYGAGIFPYLAGTAGVGNRMEIIVTQDNLKYIWLNRQGFQETFRQLVFY